MNAKDCLYLNFQKGSGRTTRMLREAIRVCVDYMTQVYVIGIGQSHIEKMQDMAISLCKMEELFPRLVQCPGVIYPLGKNCPSIQFVGGHHAYLEQMYFPYLGISASKQKVFVDHFVLETRFAKVLVELHRWDYPVKSLEVCDPREWQAARAARAKAQAPREVHKFGLEHINFSPSIGFAPVGKVELREAAAEDIAKVHIKAYENFHQSCRLLKLGMISLEEHEKNLDSFRKEVGLPPLERGPLILKPGETYPPKTDPVVFEAKTYQSQIRIPSDFITPNCFQNLPKPYLSRVWSAFVDLVKTILGKKS